MQPALEVEFAERRMEIENRKVEALERIACRLEQLAAPLDHIAERLDRIAVSTSGMSGLGAQLANAANHLADWLAEIKKALERRM